jgi:Rap1a immunity proteins
VGAAQDRDVYGFTCVVNHPSGTLNVEPNKKGHVLRNGTRVVLRWWNPGQGKTFLSSAHLDAPWVDHEHLSTGPVDRNFLDCDYEQDAMPNIAHEGSVNADGAYMLKRCSSRNEVDNAFCRGLALGIAHVANAREGSFCIRGDVQATTLLDVALRYMRDRPDRLRYSAWWLFLTSYVKMWPCGEIKE